MAEVLSSARKRNPKKFLTKSDMAAAQQLMQLSDEDSNNITNNKKKDADDDNEEVDQSRRSEITSAVIEEIFGKEDQVYRPKKRRYRTLDSIYTATKPMMIREEGEILQRP
ncbi:hypothetical protein I3843_04G081000 [Carya illinoinensis]|uniref:Uncharacterized protein n=1 Tax=Carya illinoinensis TaxID=32201 RepID=A0A8T1QT53_CARIL|nr:hypothetical protein I3760_04G087400 [Carya illinoinensis]KAG6657393.1 hypothetical protein CIPAW_04G087800 [Carya illinoinensis]KAG6717214.1 hypothetical protein I3842_04G087000 [Carya illinoinensis]KAG7982986.1 hypothetical protein I3843_04G081000 [Carya illinoinensis]